MKQRELLPPVGAASLLGIFGVVCLAVLAMLSLSTAQADARLTQGALDTVTQAYAADAASQEIFARLRSGEVPEGVIREGSCYRWACKVTQYQTLCAEVEETESGWKVLRWQTVARMEDTEELLPVWDGQRLEEDP